MPQPSTAPDLTRRRFIGSGCCAAVGVTGLLSALGSLRLIGAAASPGNIPPTAAAVPSDYKALVCLFLSGGNDANNLLIPSDSAGYAAYTAARANLALPQTGLLPFAPRTGDGRTWALHPAVPELQRLFASGQVAFLANVGTLAYPTTKAQYTAGSVPLPRQLFSHNDQSIQWQTSVPDQASSTGWGGRTADLVNALNANNQVSMSVSLSGANTFQVGQEVSRFAVDSNGAVSMYWLDGQIGAARVATQKELFGRTTSNLFETAFNGITARASRNGEYLNGILSRAVPIATTFPSTKVGDRLKMIARMISAAQALGLKRQIFFVQVDGWDTHAEQLSSTNPLSGAHTNLLAQTSQAVKAFYDATVEIGAANQVTTFTASDFGRTYRSNGNGSDHGWGSHHFIVGGAVKGGELYGRMPNLTVGGPDDVGQGRWIPTTSVDEYAATLATWFGVSATDLPVVLPNIGRFAKPNLGFL